MSKKFAYFSLLLISIVLLGIAGISAEDNSSLAQSNSSLQDSGNDLNNISSVSNTRCLKSAVGSNLSEISTENRSTVNTSSSSSDIDGLSNPNTVNISGSSVNDQSMLDNVGGSSVNDQSNLTAGTVFSSNKNILSASSVNSGKLESAKGTVLKGPVNKNTFGIFLFGKDMYNVDFSTLYKNHIGNIFLNYYAVENYGINKVTEFVQKAKNYNINVYIWMQSFYEGKWINPSTCGQKYYNTKISEAKTYANIDNLAGIVLDYLRYPGTAYKYKNSVSIINDFARNISNAAKSINPSLKIGAILMPEESSNIKYYGQDSAKLGNIVDILLPMIYKGNYNKNSAWIKSVSNYFKNHKGNAQVWTVLQSYKSDDNPVKLSVKELRNDAQAGLDGGANGIVYFRFGLTNYIDSSDLNGGINSLEKIDKNDNRTLTYFTKGSTSINAGTGSKFTVTLHDENGDIIKNQTVTINVLGQKYTRTTDERGSVSLQINLAGAKTYKISYTYKGSGDYRGASASAYLKVIKTTPKLTASNLVMYYKDGHRYYIDLKDHNGTPLKNTSIYFTVNKKTYRLTTDNNGQTSISIGLNPGKYTVTYSFKGDKYRNSVKHTGSITVNKLYYKLTNEKLAYQNSKRQLTGTLTDNKNAKIKNKRITFTSNSKNYKITTDKNGKFVLIFKSNDYTCKIKAVIDSSKYYSAYSKTKSYIIDYNFTVKQITEGAKTVENYYQKYRILPSDIYLGSIKITMAEFLYYESAALININNSSNSKIKYIGSISYPESPMMGDIIDKNISRSGYMDSVTRNYNYIINNRQSPNYSTTTLGKVCFNSLVETYSRILISYDKNSELPAAIRINTKRIEDTSSVKKLASSLCKGVSSKYHQAEIMFDWIRDNVKYDYYYNTKYGATKTLQYKHGNCCDQSNLYVALCRVMNIKIRYVHGTCYFSDGWYGHVWTEVYVNNKWYSADTINTKNTFGTINNWNKKTAKIHNRYTYLPF